jgi:repressor LexA
MAITKRQREIYDFIASYIREKGYSPSFKEIGAELGLRSLATVHKHISNLESKGLLKRDFNRSRSIDVVPPESRRAYGIRRKNFENTLSKYLPKHHAKFETVATILWNAAHF